MNIKELSLLVEGLIGSELVEVFFDQKHDEYVVELTTRTLVHKVPSYFNGKKIRLMLQK